VTPVLLNRSLIPTCCEDDVTPMLNSQFWKVLLSLQLTNSRPSSVVPAFTCTFCTFENYAWLLRWVVVDAFVNCSSSNTLQTWNWHLYLIPQNLYYERFNRTFGQRVQLSYTCSFPPDYYIRLDFERPVQCSLPFKYQCAPNDVYSGRVPEIWQKHLC